MRNLMIHNLSLLQRYLIEESLKKEPENDPGSGTKIF